MRSRFLLSGSTPTSPSHDYTLDDKLGIILPILFFVVTAAILIIYEFDLCFHRPSDDSENPRQGVAALPLQRRRSPSRAGAGNLPSPFPAVAVELGGSSQPPAGAIVNSTKAASLPVVVFSNATSTSLAGVEEGCVICLSEFELGEELTVLPKCNHGFHLECIEMWLNSPNNSCPICRRTCMF